jgi:hypothetical protein
VVESMDDREAYLVECEWTVGAQKPFVLDFHAHYRRRGSRRAAEACTPVKLGLRRYRCVMLKTWTSISVDLEGLGLIGTQAEEGLGPEMIWKR